MLYGIVFNKVELRIFCNLLNICIGRSVRFCVYFLDIIFMVLSMYDFSNVFSLVLMYKMIK